MENSEFYKRIDDLASRAERRGVVTRTAFLTPAEQYALQQYYHGDDMLLTGGGLILLVITYVLYMKHYKLDEPEYDRICAELKARRASKKA